MDNIEEIIQKVKEIKHGFVKILTEAEYYKNNHSIEDCLVISKKLFLSEFYQVRVLGVFIIGFIAINSDKAFNFLKQSVSKDNDWRVQEVLAKSFDRYCSDLGYKNSIPIIKEWLFDKNPNIRRAVTEGLRIWTSREYFKDNPKIAINYGLMILKKKKIN